MNKLKEMFKRRKEQGFTLIELMIVIAVIGILAIVLVPKVGLIKTQAKSAGVDTNMRVVEGYIQSRINNWANASMDSAAITTDLIDVFTDDEITNPYTSQQVAPQSGVKATGNPANNALYILTDGVGDDTDAANIDPAKTKGTIIVSISPAAGSTVTSIKLYPHDENGDLISGKVVEIVP